MDVEIKEKHSIIKIDGKKYKKEVFIIEDEHPAIGRIMIVDGIKFKILDCATAGSHREGTYISKMTEKDEENIKEYDEALEELSEKLTKKLDIKRLIKENMKNKPIQSIKTGLFILKAQEEGEKVDEEHHHGCYNFKLHYGNQIFEFISGSDVIEPLQ